jgi:hypothetical protein
VVAEDEGTRQNVYVFGVNEVGEPWIFGANERIVPQNRSQRCGRELEHLNFLVMMKEICPKT